MWFKTSVHTVLREPDMILLRIVNGTVPASSFLGLLLVHDRLMPGDIENGIQSIEQPGSLYVYTDTGFQTKGGDTLVPQPKLPEPQRHRLKIPTIVTSAHKIPHY